jgi:hypothetical protein
LPDLARRAREGDFKHEEYKRYVSESMVPLITPFSN